MGGATRIAAVVFLSLSLGLHWAALQSVGWASMFLDRVQRMSVGEALVTTFDGQHPCPICVAVQEGRATQGQSSGTAAPAPETSPRLDLVLNASSPSPVVVSWTDRKIPHPPRDFVIRRDPPLLEPPRLG